MTSESQTIHDSVREHYAAAATRGGSGCGCGPASGCCSAMAATDNLSARMGYSPGELATLPEGANLGLGCGNPIASAGLAPGEVVLDLGSGAGIDCFLAAGAVGPRGRVIGVDMTHEMLGRARKNAEAGGYANVEFRLGEIEHLPVADNTIDVVISNCVVNLSPDKDRVWREVFRVLKPGGRLVVSDIVSTADLPRDVRDDMTLHAACVAGADTIETVLGRLRAAGFKQAEVKPKDTSRQFISEWVPGRRLEDYLVSAIIAAVKPA
jgi:arsenite methyltransferase